MEQMKQYTPDRKHAGEIKSELKVRKWLESNTDYTFEFIRNDIQTGYDLGCWQYVQVDNLFEKRLICYIEVEESYQWRNGQYPKHWKNWAYLQRKVNKWDWANNKFLPLLKPNAKRTLYLKAAIDFSGMHCSRMEDIYKHGTICDSKTFPGDKRLSMTYRFPLYKKSRYVLVGETKCLKGIKRFLNIQSNLTPLHTLQST